MWCLALLKSPDAFISRSRDLKLAETYPHVGHIFPFPGKNDRIWPSYNSLLNSLLCINCVLLKIPWSLTLRMKSVCTMSCPHHSEQPILSWAAPFALELQELKGILPAAEGILNLCSCTQCSLAPVRNARATWS